MKIKILGHGGAISDGLPYNSFLIDDFFLAEMPPDIMGSLFREKVSLSKLRFIFISHFHADHYFGFPLFALRLFIDKLTKPADGRIKIFGPENIKKKLRELNRMAFGKNRPPNFESWIDDNMQFVELNPRSGIDLGNGLSFKVVPMTHAMETYGFSLYKNNKLIFMYFADTLWSEELLSQIKQGPGAILTDLNGEPDDSEQIHLSERDIIRKALPYCADKTVFYGTHLKKEKKSKAGKIRYVRPGDIIKI